MSEMPIDIDIDTALFNLGIAAIGKRAEEVPLDQAPQAVFDYIQQALPELSHIKLDDITILPSGNTTAVFLCDTENNYVYLSLDPTKDKSFTVLNVPIRPIEFFNFQVRPNKHELGGSAHHGWSIDLEKPNKKLGYNEAGDSKSLEEAIGDTILSCTNRTKEAFNLVAAGFSKAGPQIKILIGSMLKKDFFVASGLNLESIHTFASPAYGTTGLVSELNKRFTEKGVKVLNFLISTDKAAHILSAIYGRAGEAFTMKAENSINPADSVHSFRSYKNSFIRIRDTALSRVKLADLNQKHVELADEGSKPVPDDKEPLRKEPLRREPSPRRSVLSYQSSSSPHVHLG